MLFDVVDQELVALQPVDLAEPQERAQLEWQLAHGSEALANLDLVPLRHAALGEYGLGGGVIGISSDRELTLVQVLDALDELGVAAMLATVARLSRTPLGELIAERDDFAAEWERLTGDELPVGWVGRPQVLLAAASFSGASLEMLQLLAAGSLSVDAFTITAWRRSAGLVLNLQPMLIDESSAETDQDGDRPRRARRSYTRGGRAIRVVDLVDAGFLDAGEELTILRPRGGTSLTLHITPGGGLRVPDGQVLTSPSAAAAAALGVPAVAGWNIIVAPARGGRTLAELRDALLEGAEPTSAAEAANCAPEAPPPAPAPAAQSASIEAPTLVQPYSMWTRALTKAAAEPIPQTVSFQVPPPPPPADRDPARWVDATPDAMADEL